MNKKIVLSFVFIILAVGIYYILFLGFNKTSIGSKNILSITDSEIVKILEMNVDVSGYATKYPDFKIKSKEILTINAITAGQNAQNFKEVYQGLELQDNRYMKVDLMNSGEDRGMVTVIDFKDGKVLKAYGIMLLKASANSNAKTAN